MQPIQIYDTTLRDGTQAEGFTLSGNDKIRIARRLDDLGVTFIEGGWPGSNPKDARYRMEKLIDRRVRRHLPGEGRTRG
jgi:2-isopropylmalate synthase